MSSLSSTTGLIAWFAKNPVAANLLMLVILVAGIATAVGLRVEGFPSIDPKTIQIDVTYESGDPQQAEEGIALKIEEALQGIAGIKAISSTSTSRGTNVQVERLSGYDLDRLNTEIKNQIDGISSFPAAAEKPVVSQQLWEQSALLISVYGALDQHGLQTVARQFETALLQLPSVKKVIKTGWQQPEIAIEVDEHLLQQYSLTLDELVQIIRDESVNQTSGELRSGDGLILLKADKQRYDYRDFANIVLASNADGSRLRLGDIAKIHDDFEESPKIISRFQGLPSINLEVRVDRDDNIVAIAEESKQLLQQWRNNQQLPAGVEVELWWDQSTNMLERLSLVLENGLIGILLVMLLLSIFLNVKVAFWVGMGLPVCFAGGLILMGGSFFDLTLNQLTTFGFVLVLGILVDDAVVVGESVYSARRELGDTMEATIIGVQRVAVPTVYGVLTTVAAFFPLSLVEGDLGTLFSQFALVCTGCLLFSLLESKLILPAHLVHLQTHRQAKPSEPQKLRLNLPGQWLASAQRAADRLLEYLKHDIYRPMIGSALYHRYAVLFVFLSIWVLVVGMVPSGKVAFHFFPDIPEETITVSYKVKAGSGYLVAHQQAEKIEAVVEQLNQYWQQQSLSKGNVITRSYVLVSDDISGSVNMELSAKDSRSVNSVSVANALRDALPFAEGLQELTVSTDSHDDKDFVLNLLADDGHQLQDAATQIISVLKTVPGVTDIDNNLTAAQPQFTFELTAEGRALGMNTATLANQIQNSFYGAEVQRVQRGKDEVKVRVRYPADQRRDITDLQQARVRTPTGEIVPLSTVATLQQGYTLLEINRINGHRAATLSANIDESVMDSGEVIESLEASVLAQIRTQYPKLQIISDGDDAEEGQSMQSLVMIFMFSLLLIYMLVAVPLKSYWQPLVIMSAIPFGMVGAILGHWFSDLAISILSINGILALSGVVVNDSLLLVNRYNELCDEGVAIRDAMIEAGSQRMRAILLTSMTTCLGLVSLLRETSEQAQFLIPAATSLAYGICFATLVSLILVPVLLLILDDLKTLIRSKSVSFERDEYGQKGGIDQADVG